MSQVHYGRASFSALSRLPAYFVLGHDPLDIPACARHIGCYATAPLNPGGMKALLVFLDQGLLWALPQLQLAVNEVGVWPSADPNCTHLCCFWALARLYFLVLTRAGCLALCEEEVPQRKVTNLERRYPGSSMGCLSI